MRLCLNQKVGSLSIQQQKDTLQYSIIHIENKQAYSISQQMTHAAVVTVSSNVSRNEGHFEVLNAKTGLTGKKDLILKI